jgi:ABC-type transport system involved in cytochrome bd biosynthesis fused ATPase/permease subunit
MYYTKVSSGPVGCNLLTIVLLVLVAVYFPWTLIFIIPLALLILIPILLVVIRFSIAMWKVKRAYKRAYKNATNAQRQRTSKTKDGDVKIILTDQAERRVNDDVGEYVDFQEIKEDKNK